MREETTEHNKAADEAAHHQAGGGMVDNDDDEADENEIDVETLIAIDHHVEMHEDNIILAGTPRCEGPQHGL